MKKKQKPNLKNQETHTENDFILIDSETDKQRNVNQLGKRLSEVMCVEGNQKERRAKSFVGWEGR